MIIDILSDILWLLWRFTTWDNDWGKFIPIVVLHTILLTVTTVLITGQSWFLTAHLALWASVVIAGVGIAVWGRWGELSVLVVISIWLFIAVWFPLLFFFLDLSLTKSLITVGSHILAIFLIYYMLITPFVEWMDAQKRRR